MKQLFILEFCCSFFSELLQKYRDILSSDDCIGNILSRSIRNNHYIPELKKKLNLRKWILIWNHWIYVSILWQFFLLLVKFSDLVNLNIKIANIYWTKFNIPWKCDFKSDEDNNKHSLAPCEKNVKLHQTLFILLINLLQIN